MRYVSLFSGIEAASVAWGPLGWVPVSFSEIDPFSSAVLARRFPGVPNLGDITKIDWSKHGECVSADLVVGGSPCQSFSVAGTRTGLDGASGLMWEYVRAVRELRPRWLVWENVPGALSSSGGRDFGCLLGALDDLGYGLAWRVLDAQFFGVAQRRRRLFLVGSLGDQRAAEVLFEPEGLRWDHPSIREKRQILAGPAQGRTGGADDGASCLTPWDVQSRSIHDCDHAWPALYAEEGGGHGCTSVPYASGKANSTTLGEEESPTPKIDHNPAVLCATDSGSNSSIAEDLAPTLTAHEGKAASYVTGPCPIRRLTPTECERLQGFPDGWADIPYRGASHAPDSPRYKALGNSMAVPVMKWIGQRIQHVEGAFHGVA